MPRMVAPGTDTDRVIQRVITRSAVAADLEVSPASVPTAGSDSVRRLVAAWLLGYQSPATRRLAGSPAGLGSIRWWAALR